MPEPPMGPPTRMEALEERVSQLEGAAARPVPKQRIPEDIKRGADWIATERAKVERRKRLRGVRR